MELEIVNPDTLELREARKTPLAELIPRARGGLTDKQEKEVCRRFRAGESLADMSRALGVIAPKVAACLRKQGVSQRDIRRSMGLW